MAYDQKSADLAEHFLKDVETDNEAEYSALVNALAQVIQDAIELWLNANVDSQPTKPPSEDPPPSAA